MQEIVEEVEEIKEVTFCNQKITYDEETHKKMKMLIIELGLDGDAKINPKMFGDAIKYLLESSGR